MRILIADDDLIARLLLSELLSKYGPCDSVINGEEAVRAFSLAMQRNNPYTLVCLDIMMPEMDGQEALKRIRSIEKSQNIEAKNQSIIIMVTALVDQLNKELAHDSNCNFYLTKPIDKNVLLAVLRKFQLI